MGVPINNVSRRVVYAASGTGPYAFTFEILAAADIAVYKDDTLLTLTTDYTVTINANGTGSITLTASPTGATQIAIVGNRTIQRLTDFVTGGDLFANTINDELDQQTIFAQQNAEGLDRSLKAPQTDPTSINMTLPRASVRANKTLAFDANGNPTTGEVIGDNRGNWAAGTAYNKRDIVKDTSNGNIYYANTAHTSSGSQPISSNADSAKWDLIVDNAAAGASASAAAASASAAASSASAASTSASNASSSASSAASSASAASTSASNASTSATNAASSASTASTQASNAATSATNAANSATSASNSASTATTQATNASNSASSASTSATNAANSASSASSSASSASSSASSASTSASNASTSATNAASSATAAAASATSAAASFDSFDDRYLGAKTSDPTLDNDGNALLTGALYFNSSTGEMKVYSGSAWVSSFLTAGAQTISGVKTFSSNPILSGGTANGVAYLNGSKVLTTGSALTFDGNKVNTTKYYIAQGSLTAFDAALGGLYTYYSSGGNIGAYSDNSGTLAPLISAGSYHVWSAASELMRLTSTGLGIGTSSPGARLDVQTTAGRFQVQAYGAGSVLLNSNGVLAYNAANTRHEWQIANSTLMQLDSSGNLGLGVTPSAWSAGQGFEMKNGGAIASQGSSFTIAANTFFASGTGWTYKTSSSATRYDQSSGAHQWFTAASGTAGNAISFTQAMTLDASGNLGVGTTSPARKLSVYDTGNIPVRIETNTSDTKIEILTTSGTQFIQASANNLLFGTNNTERARITSGGYFKASNTGTYTGSTVSYHESYTNTSNYTHVFTNANASPVGALFLHSTDSNGTGNEFWSCQGATTQRAAIRSNGGLANYSGNNVNLSDRREKTNFAPAKSYLDTICAIPVQTFNYIDQSEDDPGLTLGVVAQDVQAVAPELVMESNWGTAEDPKMRLSIYQTDLQYALMKCIQELKAQNDDLRARVAQLEAK